MTGEEKGEKAVTQSRSPVDARAGIAESPREDQARPAGSSERDGEVTTPHKSKCCGSGAMALLAIGCQLHGLWSLGDLHEVQSGPFFRLRSRAGSGVWTGIAAHRTCVPCFRGSAGSLRTCKVWPVIGL
jgi:hypothetical protein